MFFESFKERRHLQSKLKVEISWGIFTHWSPTSNYPKYAVMKKFLTNPNKGKHEIEIMQQVNRLHPWTVKYYSSCINDGFFCILMEYCTKGDLRKFIKQQKSLDQGPPIDVLVRHFLSLADIILVLHKNRIWHRDIKPENIFLNGDGEVRLGDWGVSKSYMNSEPEVNYHSVTGTQPYMSPELAKRKKHRMNYISSPDSDDIWALGQTFYEMCTLQRVNISDNIHFLIYRELSRRNYPESFADLISGMLNPDLRTRFKIYDVWIQLMNIITIISIVPIYHKNDEGEENDATATKNKTITTAESETYNVQRLKFTSVKNIAIQKQECIDTPNLVLANYNIASINPAATNEYKAIEPKNFLHIPNFASLEIDERKTIDTEDPGKVSERLTQCMETGSSLANSIAQTIKVTTEIFKEIDKKTDPSSKEVWTFLEALYKENEEKLGCVICNGEDRWVKLSPKNWKPYKVKCKKCRSNFCSFCLYGGGHKKCPSYKNFLSSIWEFINPETKT